MKSKNLLALDNFGDIFVDDTPVGLPQEFAEDADRRRRVVELIDELPDKYRTPLLLHYYQGLSYGEVAETMGVSRNSVDHSLKMARKILKIELEDEFDELKKNDDKLSSLSLGAVVSFALVKTAAETVSKGMVAACMQAGGVFTAFSTATATTSTAAATGSTGFLSGAAGSVAVKIAAAAAAVAVIFTGAWYAIDRNLIPLGETSTISSTYGDRFPSIGQGIVEGFVVLDNGSVPDETACNGLEGLTVELFRMEDPEDVFQTTVTKGGVHGGKFSFSGLPAGNYFIRALLPQGSELLNAAVHPDIEESDGSEEEIEILSEVVWVGSGDSMAFKLDEDDCLDCPTMMIRLFSDVRGRLKNSGGGTVPEGAFADIKLELRDLQGKLISTTKTDKNGLYCFEDVMISQKGNYILTLIEEEDMKITFSETTIEVYLEPGMKY